MDAAWRVVRTDDNGQRFVVASGLTRERAQRLAEDLTARGHKQLYETLSDEFLDGGSKNLL